MGFPKEDNERKTNFDLPFFLNILEKNGFNMNREEIKIDKHVLNGYFKCKHELMEMFSKKYP